jgi:O-antigen ligase
MSELTSSFRHSPLADDGATPINRFASRLFFAIIALAPLPFGSYEPTTVAFWCLLLSIALAFADPARLERPRMLILLGILFFLGLFVCVVGLQISSPPWFGQPDPDWAQTFELLGAPIQESIAIPRMAPLYRLGPVFACSLSLILALILASDRLRAHQILTVFAWSGAVYALYGIVSAAIEPGMILWRERETYFGNVIGTFTFRNTAATYFGSCSVVWLLNLCEIIKKRLLPQGRAWKAFAWHLLSGTHTDILISLAGFLICLMALLMTASRAGTTISLIALMAVGIVYFRRDLPAGSKKLLVFGAVACVVLLLLQIFGGAVSQRFDTSGFSDESRWHTYDSTLRMIADHPWLGTGLGTFPWTFPHYRGAQPSLFGVWELAHSTPLELAAEMGLPLTLLVGIGWASVIVILIRGILIRRRDSKIPLAGATIALISLVHSTIDFPLQISGYAIVAMAIIGAGLAQSFRSSATN